MNDSAPALKANMQAIATTASVYGNGSDLPLCPELRDENEDESYKQFYQNAQLVTGLFIYPSICFPGLLCNALSVYVMTRRNMLTSTNAFLSALAIADSIKLLNDILYFLVIVFVHTSPRLGNLSYGYLYPYSHFVFKMSLCVSSWLTVSVAVERYILVCHATKAKAVWSRRRAVSLCTVIYIAMICLALPFALRYRTIHCLNRQTLQWRLEVEVTEMWQNKTFVVVYTWIQNLMRSIIPLIVLIILNTRIVWALRKTTRTKRRKTPRHRVTVMMIVVILAFLICITPDAILSTVFGFGYHEAGYLVKGIREITDTLLALNAAVNFLIYCAFNKVFRKRCARMCCSKEPPTGWFTEMEESTYRRLSEAKSALYTNNNSPPRQANKDVFFGENTFPEHRHQKSPSIKRPMRKKREEHLVPVRERSLRDRGVCTYIPVNEDRNYKEVTRPKKADNGENECENLLQDQSNSKSVLSDSAPKAVLTFQDFKTVGHLISASLSLPSLQKYLQDMEDFARASDSSLEYTGSTQVNYITDKQHKSLSQPFLPLLHDKYEIPECFCSYRTLQQTSLASPHSKKYSQLCEKPKIQVSEINSSYSALQIDPLQLSNDKTNDMTSQSQFRPRNRPSSNGLKKSKNSVKSRRAKHRKSKFPVTYSDSECGHSESSMSMELYDSIPRETHFGHSVDDIYQKSSNCAHNPISKDKKAKCSLFVPTCPEDIQSTNEEDTNRTYRNSRNGLNPEDNLNSLKNCDGSSLTKPIPTPDNCTSSYIIRDTMNTEDIMSPCPVLQPMPNTSKQKPLQHSTLSNRGTPKHGRGPVVRFQDTIT